MISIMIICSPIHFILTLRYFFLSLPRSLYVNVLSSSSPSLPPTTSHIRVLILFESMFVNGQRQTNNRIDEKKRTNYQSFVLFIVSFFYMLIELLPFFNLSLLDEGNTSRLSSNYLWKFFSNSRPFG